MLPGLLICHCGLILSLRADLSLFINGLEDKSMSRSKGSLEKILNTHLNVRMPPKPGNLALHLVVGVKQFARGVKA